MKFDREINEIILDIVYALDKNKVRNKYEIISKMFPQFTARKIRHHYCNNLNERLCKVALTIDEKAFIIQWVERNQDQNGTVHWKDLIPEMENRFRKLHSENKIKNFWYPRKSRLCRDSEAAASRVRASTSFNPSNVINGNNTLYAIANLSLPLPMEPNFKPSIQFKTPNKMNPLF